MLLTISAWYFLHPMEYNFKRDEIQLWSKESCSKLLFVWEGLCSATCCVRLRQSCRSGAPPVALCGQAETHEMDGTCSKSRLCANESTSNSVLQWVYVIRKNFQTFLSLWFSQQLDLFPCLQYYFNHFRISSFLAVESIMFLQSCFSIALMIFPSTICIGKPVLICILS